MHILFVFLILAGFFGELYPVQEQPKDQVTMVMNDQGQHGNDQGHSFHLSMAVAPDSELKFAHITRQEFDYSCGSGALATLLNYHLHEHFTEKQIIQGMMKYGDKEQIAAKRAFSLYDMKKFVNVLGYNGAGYKGELEDLMNSQYWPCIVPIKLFQFRHFVVVKGFLNGRVFLADPFKGNTNYTIAKFEDMWFNNIMFVIMQKDKKVKEPSGLRIREADLRYIDRTMERTILFDPLINGMPPRLKGLPPKEFIERAELINTFDAYKDAHGLNPETNSAESGQ